MFVSRLNSFLSNVTTRLYKGDRIFIKGSLEMSEIEK